MKKHDMHDDITRRKVFWLLQRLTSWTLWRTKHENFKIFAVAYENAVKTWPLSQSNRPRSPRSDLRNTERL